MWSSGGAPGFAPEWRNTQMEMGWWARSLPPPQFNELLHLTTENGMSYPSHDFYVFGVIGTYA